MLRTKLTHYASFTGSFRQNTDFCHIMAHRFLAIDMFSQLNGLKTKSKMIMIGHTHIYSIERIRFILKKLPPIGIRFCIGKCLSGSFQMLFVHITNGDNVNIRVRFELIQVMPTHSANAYTNVS